MNGLTPQIILATIDKQISDWTLQRYSIELQIRTHQRLIELGLSNDDAIKALTAQLSACEAALYFLDKERENVLAPSLVKESDGIEPAKGK